MITDSCLNFTECSYVYTPQMRCSLLTLKTHRGSPRAGRAGNHYIHTYIHTYHTGTPLQWRHNERDVVSNHQPHDCLLSRLFRRRSKKRSKLRVTGLYEGNSPVAGEFPSQRASNAKNVSIWSRYQALTRKPGTPSGPWWRYEMETITAFRGKSTPAFPHKSSVMRTFDDLCVVVLLKFCNK